MKQYIFLITIFLTSLNSFSQNKGIVYYGQIESIGLSGPFGPDFNAYLTFNNEASYYVTAKDSLDAETSFKLVYDNNDGTRGVSYSVYTTPFGKQVYFNKKSDSIYWNQWVNFYVAEKRPKINWQLKTETKKIGKFTAHKATGMFRGRVYTAWYTIDIPLPYGPWKLQGLPGLILEAYDENKEMFLYFKSLEYPTDNKAKISQINWPKDIKENWLTLQDFKNRVEDIYEKKRDRSILIAERLGSDVPEQKIKSEVLLESFE